MRVGEDVCSVLPAMGNSDAGYCNEGLPDDVRNRRSDNVMGALTECTILMGSTVHMKVRKLECGPDEQKEPDEPDAQISDPWVLWTDSTYSSHRNSHYSSGLQVCQSIKTRQASKLFGLIRVPAKSFGVARLIIWLLSAL